MKMKKKLGHENRTVINKDKKKFKGSNFLAMNM